MQDISIYGGNGNSITANCVSIDFPSWHLYFSPVYCDIYTVVFHLRRLMHILKCVNIHKKLGTSTSNASKLIFVSTAT